MNKKLTKHLYVHIPFCKSICTYCDFVRYVKSQPCICTYINKIIKQIQSQYKLNQFKTIYIGGGTPNSLPNKLLNKLLHVLSHYLDKEFEFTVECNPEFLTSEQTQILKCNKVNRVSIGMQTIKPTLLHKLNRKHTMLDVTNSIKHLHKVGIHNISVDLIYGLNELTTNDILKTISYVHKMHIPHVSWYGLELKPNSILNKQDYKLDEVHIEAHLKFIVQHMRRYYRRYEVSNWAICSKYESNHNKAYWTTQEWTAIGLGSCGFENMTYYENKGSLSEWSKFKTKYNQYDYYFQIMLMGLRLVKGIDLSIQQNRKAYNYFSRNIKYVHIHNNYLIHNNINLLDATLIDLI